MNGPVALYNFLSGAVAFGFVICGLFFARFWWRTKDQLFLAFALAFGLLGASQAVIVLANVPTEERSALFLFRLAAFALIIVAIFNKNRRSRN